MTLDSTLSPVLTIASGTLSIDLNAIKTEVGYDGDINTITASKALTTLMLWLKSKTATLTDDPAIGLTIADGFKTFVIRGTENQISNSLTVNIYSVDTASTIDPDNTI